MSPNADSHKPNFLCSKSGIVIIVDFERSRKTGFNLRTKDNNKINHSSVSVTLIFKICHSNYPKDWDGGKLVK